MKRIVLIAFLAAFASATTTPTFTKVLGFGSAHVYAQENDDSQGDNDNQGENGQ